MFFFFFSDLLYCIVLLLHSSDFDCEVSPEIVIKWILIGTQHTNSEDLQCSNLPPVMSVQGQCHQHFAGQLG